MCKLMIAAAAALLSLVSLSASARELTPSQPVARQTPVVASTSNTSWVALAVSPNGRVFQSDSINDENRARTAAREECEQTSGRTCRDTMSVPENWDVVVLRCADRNFLGGSALGLAYDNALDKATQQGFTAGRCRQIANY